VHGVEVPVGPHAAACAEALDRLAAMVADLAADFAAPDRAPLVAALRQDDVRAMAHYVVSAAARFA